MNSKSFGLFALSFLAFVLVMSGVSAAVFNISGISIPGSVTESSGSFAISFNIYNTGADHTISWAGSTVNQRANFSFSTLEGSTLTAGSNTSITATVNFPLNFSGTLSGNIVATPSGSNPSTIPFSVTVVRDIPAEVASCLGTGNPGQLNINSISFTNNGLPNAANTTFGDDNKWFPFEKINTKVDVKNSGTFDINNIEVDWGVWDTQKQQWVIVPTELKNIDLGSGGKTKSLYQSFSIDNNMDVDLSSLTNGNHYQFYVIANGNVNNASSTTPTCKYRAQNAAIEIQSDFVTFTSLNVPTTVQCGQTMQVTGQLWNIGNNGQNSVSVDILGSDSSLKLSQHSVIGDVSSFSNKQFSFSFPVPSAIDEKTYGIKFNVLDENGNIFQENTNDHYSEFLIPFSVSGGCIPQVSLVAIITSGGQAGKPLVVKATVTNTGTVTKTYTVSAASFQNWASSASVDQGTITLNPGQSQGVSVTLNPNSDVSGSQTFSVDLTSNTGQTITQPVSVNIASAPGFLGLGGSAWIWVLGALILILVLVIIIVAIRVGRRK